MGSPVEETTIINRQAVGDEAIDQMDSLVAAALDERG
jgi:hypothetical protein